MSSSSALALLARSSAQLVGALANLGVVEQFELGLEAVDRVDAPLVLLQLLALADAKGAIDDSPCHVSDSG